MKKIIFLLSFSFSTLSLTHAAESEIILINSSAFVVELNDNFDVIRVIEELPNYFSEDATHEELLDAFVSNNSDKVDGSLGEISNKECRAKTIVDISTISGDPDVVFCSQNIDNQSFTSKTLSSFFYKSIQGFYVDPKYLEKALLG